MHHKRKMRWLLAVLSILCLNLSVEAKNDDPALKAFSRIQGDARLRRQLQAVVKDAVSEAFGRPTEKPGELDPIFETALPLFVTAKSEHGVRGCMGSLHPRHGDLADEIRHTLKRAFFQDPRHHPIVKSELPGLEIYLTAVGRPRQIRDPAQINPARDAILVRHGRKQAVVLAGEAKTTRYLLAFARAKAGLSKNEPANVYLLPTFTLKAVIKENLPKVP